MNALTGALQALSDSMTASRAGNPGQARMDHRRARTHAAVAQAEALTRIADNQGEALIRMADALEFIRAALEAQTERADTDSLRGIDPGIFPSIITYQAPRTDGLRTPSPFGDDTADADYSRNDYNVGYGIGYAIGLKSSDSYQRGLARGREQNAAEVEAWQQAPRWEPVEERLDIDEGTFLATGKNACAVYGKGISSVFALPDGVRLCRLVEPGEEADNA